MATRRSRLLFVFALLASLVLLFGAGCASGGAGAPSAAAAPAPPPPPPVVGSWNLVIETPIGTQQSVLEVMGTTELLEGKLKSEQGEVAIRDVVFAGDKITFGVTIDAQGQPMDLTFEGTVAGDSLTGAFQSPFGPAPTTGTRAVQ